MQRFKVAVRGRGLRISLDVELDSVVFQVSWIVVAATVAEAQELALGLVAGDWKAQPLPGFEAPLLTVELVEPSSGDLSSQPGFSFYPYPEGVTL